MPSGMLEAVDPFTGLEQTLDEFEQILQTSPLVDAEERQNAVSAYENTSKRSLESFLQLLSQRVGIRKEGILRLADLFNLIRPWAPLPEGPRRNGTPLILFGVLKFTLVAGHHICGDSATVTAKLDQLSQHTSTIRGDEPNIGPDEVVQGSLAQLASSVIEVCSGILRLRSRAEIQAYEPPVYNIDQVCWRLEKETEKAQKAVREREQGNEQKRIASEERIQKVQAWIEDMVGEDMRDKHDSIASSRVAGTGATFVCKVQEWLKAKKAPTFLAHGSPGVGKTYLACAVILQHFQQPLEGVDGIAYNYFTYDDRDRQTPFVVYAAIVSQLLRHSSELREEMFRLFEEQKKLARKQKWQILKTLRRAVAKLETSKLIVFDALDEAGEETRDEILNLLESARSDSPRILLTSRSDYRESLPHEQVQSYRVYADADDIRAFSDDRLKSRHVRRLVKAKYGTGAEAERFASNISEEILTNSHGLFLHAYYATKDVCEQVNISGIRQAASKQHKDANVIYTVTLEQIDALGATKKNLAHRTIAWLTFTKKPFEENEIKEAFAVDNRNGRVNAAAQLDLENLVEYCRGLVVRVKTRRVSYLRLAHMTAQEYFLQVDYFQQYHVDMCLTCFSRVTSCLPQNRMNNQVQDSPDNQRGETREDQDDPDDIADEYMSDSSANEAFDEPSSPCAEEEDDEECDSEDDGDDDDQEIGDFFFEDSDPWTMFEDHQSWRFGGDVWPKTLRPWIAKKTPFSLYAGSYALSHLKDSAVTPDLEKTIFTFIKAAISRRRTSTISSKSQDHPYRMNMLHMATFIGIPSIVEEVLRMPTIHVDDKDVLGRTALMWALGLGKESVAERLLEEGAQIQECDRRQRSTLLYAPAIKNEALLTKLLQNIPRKHLDARLLCSCAKANNVYLIDGVLSRTDININHINENGRTPIHEAVINDSNAALNSLVRHGARISVLDREGRTPLMYAAEGQNSDIVDILIRAGANPDPLIPQTESPLHIAAKNIKGGPRILQTLLKADAQTFVEDENGLVPLQTLLHVCRDNHYSEKEAFACVKLLSANPNTICHQSNDGANALHDVVQCPYISVLSYLVSRAPPNTVNAQKNHGQTPIFEALIAYNVPAFDLLIDLPGIDLLATRDDKKTLLNCAAWANEITVARKLIDKEPQLIKLAEQHRVSAIHYAVERDNSAMFELLLEAGSDPRSRRINTDLISYAAFEGRVWCLDILLKMRAWMAYDQPRQLVAHKDDQDKTLLHQAAASGSAAVLRKILSSLPLEGLSLEDRDVLGQTPLHYAARARNETLVGLLLTAGSDKNALTITGETPLDLALKLEARDTVGTLVLADAHVGRGSHPEVSKIQCYENEDFFAKLNDMMTATSMKIDDIVTDVRPYKEKTVLRIGTERDIFTEWSPDMPFLEITVPGNVALPINQVIFETISHDQGYSHEAHQWGGTYDHSHSYFDAAVQNAWESSGDIEQSRPPRIRVQTNVHADFNFRTHVNTFDCAEPNQERKEWVQNLRPGDRIQLYAIAMYPGWHNFVQKAGITIRYHEVARGEGTKDNSMEELPEKLRDLKTLEQTSRKSPFHRPKAVIYHKSLHAENGILTSLRPLVRENTGITAVILGNFHLRLSNNEIDVPAHANRANDSAAMYLNEFAIDDTSIEDMWVDVEYLQREGVKVIGMLSMRGDNDINWLGDCGNSSFERSYKALHYLVVSKRLDGFNLDNEVTESQSNAEGTNASHQGVNRLIDSLHADFGSNFIIVMTASAEALLRTNTDQQGKCIDYQKLELQRGHLISWYHVRIFSSWRPCNEQSGGTDDPSPIFVRELNGYIRLLQHDVYPAHKILMAISTSPNAVSEIVRDRGAYVDLFLFGRLLGLLRWSYDPVNFGGVAGWQYSGARVPGDVGGSSRPWNWVKAAKAIMDSVFPEGG